MSALSKYLIIKDLSDGIEQSPPCHEIILFSTILEAHSSYRLVLVCPSK